MKAGTVIHRNQGTVIESYLDGPDGATVRLANGFVSTFPRMTQQARTVIAAWAESGALVTVDVTESVLIFNGPGGVALACNR